MKLAVSKLLKAIDELPKPMYRGHIRSMEVEAHHIEGISHRITVEAVMTPLGEMEWQLVIDVKPPAELGIW